MVFWATLGSQGNVALASYGRGTVWAGMPGKLQPIVKDGDPITGLPGNVLFSNYYDQLYQLIRRCGLCWQGKRGS